MKTNSSKIIAGIQLLVAFCVVGVLRFWAPVCNQMLTLENGRTVHMKCFYTDRAAMMISIILIVCALILIFSKKDVRAVQIVSFITSLLLFLTFSKIIGVCMNSEMPCNLTSLWVKGLAILSMILSAVDLFVSKDGQLPS